MKAYKHLIKYSLAQNCLISVWDGEEWQVKRSTGYKAIIDAVESVEEAALRISDKEGNFIATAYVSAFGLEDDETVIDNSDNEFMSAWDEAYATA